MESMTKRQQEIADYIESFSATHGHSPTYREIQAHFNLSSLGTVYGLIKTLKRKGILEGHGARSLTFVNDPSKEHEVPLIGKLVDTLPLQTYSNIRQLAMPLYLLPDADCYLIQVEGTALLEELILEGDYLLIEPRSTFADGELVLALIDGMTSLIKKVYADPPYLRFESLNPHVQPMMLREDHVEILGVIASMLRLTTLSSQHA